MELELRKDFIHLASTPGKIQRFKFILKHSFRIFPAISGQIYPYPLPSDLKCHLQALPGLRAKTTEF